MQQIPFPRLQENEITDALVKKFGVTQDNASQAAFLCDGNFNEAIKQLTQNDEQLSFLEHFQSFMRLAFSHKPKTSLALSWPRLT